MPPVTFSLNPVELYQGWEEPVSAEGSAVSHVILGVAQALHTVSSVSSVCQDTFVLASVLT